ncbi:hypothetical protein Trydic_g13189 [Trypoxylus dichotomus]
MVPVPPAPYCPSSKSEFCQAPRSSATIGEPTIASQRRDMSTSRSTIPSQSKIRRPVLIRTQSIARGGQQRYMFLKRCREHALHPTIEFYRLVGELQCPPLTAHGSVRDKANSDNLYPIVSLICDSTSGVGSWGR